MNVDELTALVTVSDDVSRGLDAAVMPTVWLEQRLREVVPTSDAARVRQLLRAVAFGLQQSGVVLDEDRAVLWRLPNQDDWPEDVATRVIDRPTYPRDLAVEIAAVEAAHELSVELDVDDDPLSTTILSVIDKADGLVGDVVPLILRAVLRGLLPTGLTVMNNDLEPWPDQDGAVDKALDEWLQKREYPGHDGPWLARLP